MTVFENIKFTILVIRIIDYSQPIKNYKPAFI